MRHENHVVTQWGTDILLGHMTMPILYEDNHVLCRERNFEMVVGKGSRKAISLSDDSDQHIWIIYLWKKERSNEWFI